MEEEKNMVEAVRNEFLSELLRRQEGRRRKMWEAGINERMQMYFLVNDNVGIYITHAFITPR